VKAEDIFFRVGNAAANPSAKSTPEKLVEDGQMSVTRPREAQYENQEKSAVRSESSASARAELMDMPMDMPRFVQDRRAQSFPASPIDMAHAMRQRGNKCPVDIDALFRGLDEDPRSRRPASFSPVAGDNIAPRSTVMEHPRASPGPQKVPSRADEIRDPKSGDMLSPLIIDPEEFDRLTNRNSNVDANLPMRQRNLQSPGAAEYPGSTSPYSKFPPHHAARAMKSAGLEQKLPPADAYANHEKYRMQPSSMLGRPGYHSCPTSPLDATEALRMGLVSPDALFFRQANKPQGKGGASPFDHPANGRRHELPADLLYSKLGGGEYRGKGMPHDDARLTYGGKGMAPYPDVREHRMAGYPGYPPMFDPREQQYGRGQVSPSSAIQDGRNGAFRPPYDHPPMAPLPGFEGPDPRGRDPRALDHIYEQYDGASDSDGDGKDDFDPMVSATASAWSRAIRNGCMQVMPWISEESWREMQKLSGASGGWWLQVYAKGRGPDLWVPEMRASELVVVHGRARWEGICLWLENTGTPSPEIAAKLDAAAARVRKQTRHCEKAKRRNRSRLYIKSAPFFCRPGAPVPRHTPAEAGK
jgi:hypothetical protein